MVQFESSDDAKTMKLGLVGIPCYGTIFAAYVYAVYNARACRNSLLWYNRKLIETNLDLLGLVGIPCYGTMLEHTVNDITG